MPSGKKRKEPTLSELRKEIRQDVKRWHRVKKHGTTDPFWEDGMNLSLIRSHISYDVKRLRERCRRDKIRPCPPESKTKTPPHVAYTYCAPKSKAGPCKERRKRAATRKRNAARRRRRARR